MIKEYGSDFQFVESVFNFEIEDSVIQKINGSTLYFSGRTALYELLKFGIKHHGWKHLFIPNYYCHEVSEFISELTLAVSYYDNAPDLASVDVSNLNKEGNVILNVNFFGFLNALSFERRNAFLIEDHTHSLTTIGDGTQSEADYCFASLRKSIPVPCGGMVWSPRNLKLPDNLRVSPMSQSVADMKLSGMKRKTEYLKGEHIPKEAFRNLLLESELRFSDLQTAGGLPDSVRDLVMSVSVGLINKIKTANLKYIVDRINRKNLLFHSNHDDFSQALGLILILDNLDEREKMKAHLIANSIYPAILWPGQFSDQSRLFSNKMLFIHCDVRYNKEDMEFIAQTINQLK